jgi:uncharacterized repeat protein (TIGR01451 family)
MVCATAGNDGPNATISGTVNTYYPGVGTATANTTTISVGAPTGAAATISPGDLLLVIQMQGAEINAGNTAAYGNGAAGGAASGALNNANFTAGLYEYVSAVSFTGATITVRGRGAGNGLVNTYTTNTTPTATQGQRTFQVVRVPQYSSATVTGTLTAPAWNGATGGIVAIDVAGALAINGAVNVDGKGFRGGGGRGTAGGGTGTGTPTNTDYRLVSSFNLNGQKGEGIVGTPHYIYDGTSVIDTGVEGYPNGDTARGAPGNAGGGGTDGATNNNEENSGGGGGGNAGTGGVGGMTWRSRLSIGGYGGLMTVAPSATRVVMGGGGGAGSRNNSSTVAASGAAGGGIILIRAGTLSGAGALSANGADAYNNTLNDGGGGGGAGGSILVSLPAAGNYTGALTLNARGGRGGDAWNAQAVGTICGSAPCDTDNRHGPGGGGGGGYVATIWGAAANVAGGTNGITTTVAAPNNVYGATPGSTGTSTTLTAASVPGASSGAQCVPSLTVTKTTSTPTLRNTQTGVAATYTITVANAANLSAASNVTLSDTLPTLFTYASTGPINLNGGATRSSPTNPTVGATVPAWSLFTIPGGGSVALTFTVNIDYTANGTYQNPATATYLDPKRTTNGGTTTSSYNSASSTAEDVTVTGVPLVVLDKTCTSPANCMDPAARQTPGTDLTYSITYKNTGGLGAASLVVLDNIPAQTDFKVGSESHSTPLPAALTSVLVEYFDSSTSTWITNPASGGGGAPAGYNRNITRVRWTFSGTLNAASTTGSVSFTVRIK